MGIPSRASCSGAGVCVAQPTPTVAPPRPPEFDRRQETAQLRRFGARGGHAAWLRTRWPRLAAAARRGAQGGRGGRGSICAEATATADSADHADSVSQQPVVAERATTGRRLDRRADRRRMARRHARGFLLWRRITAGSQSRSAFIGVDQRLICSSLNAGGPAAPAGGRREAAPPSSAASSRRALALSQRSSFRMRSRARRPPPWVAHNTPKPTRATSMRRLLNWAPIFTKMSTTMNSIVNSTPR